MLTVYKPPDKEGMSEEEYRKIIPIGKPYLTTINGKVVFARDKPKKENSKSSLNLLGEVFGLKTEIVRHKRAKSTVNPVKGQLDSGGVTYVPLAQVIPYTTPIPQQPLPVPATPMQYYPQTFYHSTQQPPVFAQRVPSQSEPHRLTGFEHGFEKRSVSKSEANTHEEVRVVQKVEVVEVKTTITLVRHICANCGRLRSKRFHVDNPIKPGDTPPAMFCRRCQKDASSTSAPDSEVEAKERRRRREKKQLRKSDKGKELAETKKSAGESESEEGEEPSTSVKQLLAGAIKKLQKKRDQENSKKKSKSSQKPTVKFESPIAKENRQHRRKRHDSRVQENGASEQPTISGPTRRSVHSPIRSLQSEIDKASSRCTRRSANSPKRSHESRVDIADCGPPLPPNIRDENNKNAEQCSSPIHNMMFKDAFVHRRNFAEKDAGEVPEDERRSQELNRQPSFKHGRVSSRARSSTRHHEGSKHLQKGPDRKKEYYDRHRYDPANQYQDSTQPSHHRLGGSQGSDTGYFDNSDSRRAETGYDISEHSISQPASQNSGINRNYTASEKIAGVSIDARESKSHRSRHGSRALDYGQLSQSTTSHHVLKRSSSSKHSASSVNHKHSFHRTEKTSEKYVSKNSARSSSELSKVKDRRQRRHTSHSSTPGAAWNQPLHKDNYANNTRATSLEHNIAENHKDKSTYLERDADVGGHGVPTRNRTSPANHSSPSDTTEHEYTSKARIPNEYVTSKETKQDRSSTHSVKDSKSSHQARHGRQSEPSVDIDDLFSSQKLSSHRSNTNFGRSSDQIKQSSYQSEAGYESEQQDTHPQWNKSREGECQDENGFSATDAVKHFRDDWTHNKSDYLHHNHRGKESSSITSNSERSFTTADASNFYQKAWDSQSLEGMKTLEHRVHSSEPDPTSSEIGRYYECPDKEAPTVPPPPMFIIKELSDDALQVSPVRRRFNTSSQGKHHKAPSVIWEGSEHVSSNPLSLYGLGLGMAVSDPRSGSSSRRSSRGVISCQRSRHKSSESSPIVGVVSPAESVVRTPAQDQDEESDSGSDTTIEADRGFDQEPVPRGTQTAATSFEDPSLAKAANDRWYTVTGSQLDMIARQDAVPGFGLIGFAGGGSSAQDGGSDSPALRWGEATAGEKGDQSGGQTNEDKDSGVQESEGSKKPRGSQGSNVN